MVAADKAVRRVIGVAAGSGSWHAEDADLGASPPSGTAYQADSTAYQLWPSRFGRQL
jgi:hypothetical protein